MDQTAPIFRAKGLSKTYRSGEVEVPALRGVDFEAWPGEFLVILGPSGSGKSTFLNIIGGLDRATSGEAWFQDHDLTHSNDRALTLYRREHVGFVFQFYNLVPWLTARENVRLVTEIARRPMKAEAALGLARAELERARAQVDYAQSELQRTGALATRGALPTRSLEQARLDAAAAQAALQSARANVQMRQRELESARAALIEEDGGEAGEQCCVEVLAPASGRILRVLTESEQVVPAGTPLVEIGDPSDLEVEVELLSADAVRVREGAPVSLEDWGGAPLAAHVARIDPSAETELSALGIEEQRVTAVLTLDGQPSDWAALGDGYSVTARIEVWRGEDRPAVPVGALFRSGGDWAVFRVEDGRARLALIEIGERNADWAELREGLEPGATVILHPSDRIADGVRVTVREGS